ncbi:AIR carboxylase family protein [Candidatus Bathyarchaeota archaeon]|nr:AIR carboxylase family protein [Candidatus Bathyarchaeota archaeon]
MSQGKVVVFMGSKRDYEFASRINKFLQEEGFSLKCEYVVASAHKTPKILLEEVEKYENLNGHVVFITVAGLSDALSGVVAGASKYPVIACPPDSEKFWWAKFFSSAVTPQGIAVAYIPRPENAALAAAKILALFDKSLQRKVEAYMQSLKEGAKAQRLERD